VNAIYCNWCRTEAVTSQYCCCYNCRKLMLKNRSFLFDFSTDAENTKLRSFISFVNWAPRSLYLSDLVICGKSWMFGRFLKLCSERFPPPLWRKTFKYWFESEWFIYWTRILNIKMYLVFYSVGDGKYSRYFGHKTYQVQPLSIKNRRK